MEIANGTRVISRAAGVGLAIAAGALSLAAGLVDRTGTASAGEPTLPSDSGIPLTRVTAGDRGSAVDAVWIVTTVASALGAGTVLATWQLLTGSVLADEYLAFE